MIAHLLVLLLHWGFYVFRSQSLSAIIEHKSAMCSSTMSIINYSLCWTRIRHIFLKFNCIKCRLWYPSFNQNVYPDLYSLAEEEEVHCESAPADPDGGRKFVWTPVPVNTHLTSRQIRTGLSSYHSMSDLSLTSDQMKRRRYMYCETWII